MDDLFNDIHASGAREMLDRIRASIREYYEVIADGQDPRGRVGLDSEIATLLDAIRSLGYSRGRQHQQQPPLSFHDKVDRLEG